ncbi:hypothetical protein D3C72_156390 [compost metagenome]
MQVILIIISKYIFNLDLRYLYCRYTCLFTEKLSEKQTIDIYNALIFYNYKYDNKKIDQVYLGLLLTHGLVDDLFDVIHPVFGLLVCRSFTHIVVLIPRVLMENFHFSIGYFFRVFNADKTIALVFDLSSVEETTNTEESGLFSHYYINFFLNQLAMQRLNDLLIDL